MATSSRRRSILKPPTFQLFVPHGPTCATAIQPLPKTLTDRFPIELVDYCMGFLCGDKETLLNCALVCRLWLSIVRPRIIPRKFVVYVRDQTASDVFTILTAPHSTIAEYIQHLYIQTASTVVLRTRKSQRNSLRPESVDEKPPEISFNRYLLPFVGASRSLRRLTFHGITRFPRGSPGFSGIISHIKALSSLTRLELTRCSFSTFEELLSMICSSEVLLELSLTEIGVVHWSDQLPSPHLHPPPHLAYLSLNTPGQTVILEWILSQPHISKIKTVSLGITANPDDQKAVGQFLKVLGRKVRHLKFNLPRCLDHIDLSHNTRLQSLSLTRCLIGGVANENISSSTGQLFKILRQISSQQLIKIYLHFINIQRDLVLMPWGTMAQVLDSPKFSRLRLVRIQATGEKDKWEPILRAVFPRLSQLGILHFLWDRPHDSVVEVPDSA